jgi:hypothetical protein
VSFRALVIRPHWIDLILKRKKTLEIWGSRTTARGTIALIPSSSRTRDCRASCVNLHSKRLKSGI